MRKFPHDLKEIISIIESRYYVYYSEDGVLDVNSDLYVTERKNR